MENRSLSKRICRLAAALILLSTLAAQSQNQELSKVREWKGKNGKSFQGQYVGEEGDIVMVYSQRADKILRINRSNLAQETLDWLEQANAAKPTSIRPGPPSKAPDGYSPVDFSALDRTLIPEFGPTAKNRAGKAWISDCLAPFFVWWDASGQIEIPRGGKELEDRQQWVRKELSAAIRSDAEPLKMDRVEESFRRYYKRHFKDQFTVAVREVAVGPHEAFAKMVKSSAATMVFVTGFRDGKETFWYPAALVDAREDGSVALDLYGKRVSGIIAPTTETVSYGSNGSRFTCQEIKLDPGTELPEQVAKDSSRLFIRRGVFAVQLFRKKEEKK